MIELLAKYFSGNVSDEEKSQIDSWRNESEQNAAEFFEYATIWNRGAGEVEFDKKSALNSVMAQINAPSNVETPVVNLKSGKTGWKSYLRYAAVLIMGLGLAFYLMQQEEIIEIPAETLAVIQTTDREQQEIVLPDGSKVSLDENSSLSYSQAFDGSTREVELDGKAFFEIKRNINRPFIVRTEETEVRVLGTSFLVNTAAKDHSTEIVVATGKVAVAKNSRKYKNNTDKVELTPGEKATIVRNGEVLAKTVNENTNFLAWKTSIIEFSEERMSSVIETLEEVYHVKIDVSDSNIENCKLTATFDHRPIGSVMEIIAASFGSEVQEISKFEYRLVGQNCVMAN